MVIVISVQNCIRKPMDEICIHTLNMFKFFSIPVLNDFDSFNRFSNGKSLEKKSVILNTVE